MTHANRRRTGHINLKVEPDYWEVTVYLGRDPATRKRRYKSRCVRGSYKDAERTLAQLIVETGAGDVSAYSSISTTGLLSEYLTSCRHRQLSPLTIEGYESIARGIEDDGLGATPIDRASPRDFDKYYARMTARGCEPGTVNRHRSLLRAAYNQGRKWQWLTINPVELSTPPQERIKKVRLPKEGIMKDLIAVAATSRNPANALALRFAFASGGRRGELCDRRWPDLDDAIREIWIHGSIAQLNCGELLSKATKDYQDRTILLDSVTVEALRRHHDNQRKIAKEHGVELRSDAFIFANQDTRHRGNPDGSIPCRPDRLTQAFRRLRGRVPGAETLRLHDLRHLSATGLIDRGVSLPNVANRLGHRLETLTRRYAHETEISADSIEQLASELDSTAETVSRPRKDS